MSTDYDFDVITLERTAARGLGLSIAGGTDVPRVVKDDGEYDDAVYVAKIYADGAAEADGRLRVGDVLLMVNDVCLDGVPHVAAVEALKTAGASVTLYVRREARDANGRIEDNDGLLVVELRKGSKGLGLTIAGGIGNQHIPGDNGIFVSNVIVGAAASLDGRISVGDRLVSVSSDATSSSAGYNDSDANEFYFSDCTHEEAVAALKRAKGRVRLRVAKGGEEIGLVASGGISRPPSNAHPHEVLLQRHPSLGLGFNIVGNATHGVFVSFVLDGGPASNDGGVRTGDRILSVNGMDVVGARHEEVAGVLRGAGRSVTLRLKHCPGEYESFQTNFHSNNN